VFDEYDSHLDKVLPQLLSLPQRPTAIFAGFDTLAEHIYLAAQRLGVQVPEELSIVYFGSASREGAILKRLSVVEIDEFAAGRKAVELLEEMREGRRSIHDSERFALPLKLSDAQASKPASKRGSPASS